MMENLHNFSGNYVLIQRKWQMKGRLTTRSLCFSEGYLKMKEAHLARME
jgi:hypothetical protein